MNAADFLRALAFAAHKHRDQRRKNVEASPYINHPISVAEILAREGGVAADSILIAAVLHDTVEDTETSFAELEAEFGTEVAGLVREVTDDKSVEKQQRKALQVAHARNASLAAKQLKIADKLCNVRDIAESPPDGWSMERKLDYLEWAERVVAGCRGVNPALETAFDEALAKAHRALGAKRR